MPMDISARLPVLPIPHGRYNAAVLGLIYAQVSFFLCLGVTVAYNQAALSGNRGLSYYGEHLDTAIPFGLGFILCTVFMIKAAGALSRWRTDTTFRLFRIFLWCIAAMLIAILATPYGKSAWLNMVHYVFSMVLFVTELGMAGWLLYLFNDRLVMRLLFGAQLLTGFVAMLSLYKVVPFLGQSSIVYQFFFGMLLVFSLQLLTGRHRSNSLSRELAQSRAGPDSGHMFSVPPKEV